MLPNVKKILYATELSDSSRAACLHALYLAKETGAEIHMLHVTEKLSNEAMVALETYMMNTEKRALAKDARVKAAKQRFQERLDNLWEQADDELVALKSKVAEVDVREGYPAEEILKKSKEKEFDLIVMGAHDKGVIHTFLGGVAKSVLRRSRIPVLIVPAPEPQ